MTRFIALLLLLIILRLALKSFTVQLKAAVFGPPEPPRSRPAPQMAAQTLVQCETCGTYVDATRTLQGTEEGRVFCSEACRQSATV